MSDLPSEQEKGVVTFVDDLADWTRPGHRIHSLPGGRRMLARVSNQMLPKVGASGSSILRFVALYTGCLRPVVVSARRHKSGAVSTGDSVV